MVKCSNLASKVQNFSRIIAPRKIAPNPKSNPNPNLNPNHNPAGGRETIFVGGNCPDTVQNTSKTYFLCPIEKNMEYRDLTFEKFEKAFKLVKRKKAAGHNNIDSNVIIKA